MKATTCRLVKACCLSGTILLPVSAFGASSINAATNEIPTDWVDLMNADLTEGTKG
jgi:hypothetical protein